MWWLSWWSLELSREVSSVWLSLSSVFPCSLFVFSLTFAALGRILPNVPASPLKAHSPVLPSQTVLAAHVYL